MKSVQMKNFHRGRATAAVIRTEVDAATFPRKNPVCVEQRTLWRKLTAAVLSVAAYASTGCLPDDATGPGVDLYAHAPQSLRPFLGVYFDVSITYHDLQTRDSQACEIEKLPFEPPGVQWSFGVEHDMRSHLGVEYMNLQPRLATLHPGRSNPEVEIGRLDVDAGSGEFTFSHSYVDHHLGATHKFLFDGGMVDPAAPDRLYMVGRYTRISRTGNQCAVTFSIKGHRAGAFMGSTYIPDVS